MPTQDQIEEGIEAAKNKFPIASYDVPQVYAHITELQGTFFNGYLAALEGPSVQKLVEALKALEGNYCLDPDVRMLARNALKEWES